MSGAAGWRVGVSGGVGSGGQRLLTCFESETARFLARVGAEFTSARSSEETETVGRTLGRAGGGLVAALLRRTSGRG